MKHQVKVIYPVRSDWNESEERIFEVGEVEAPDAMTACELMFKGFNVVEPNPGPNDPGYYNTIFHCRSLSVGDIVEVDGVRHRCEAMGFREMEEDEDNEYQLARMFE